MITNDIEKRNVAALYEYWLFFQLLKIVAKVFGALRQWFRTDLAQKGKSTSLEPMVLRG